MGKYKDLTGEVFGRLTVDRIVRGEYPNGRTWIKWACHCECGEKSEVVSQNLLSGHTKSCGCLNKEIVSILKTKHGMRGTPEYQSWAGMKTRCDNPEADNYEYYGGRGIKYCEDWESFELFFRDMGERPDGMTLDRINPDGDYCKENCRWATKKEQSFNSRLSKNNTSGRTGVFWHTRDFIWCAYIRVDGEQKSLGCFAKYEEAVRAREMAEVEVYGYTKV